MHCLSFSCLSNSSRLSPILDTAAPTPWDLQRRLHQCWEYHLPHPLPAASSSTSQAGNINSSESDTYMFVTLHNVHLWPCLSNVLPACTEQGVWISGQLCVSAFFNYHTRLFLCSAWGILKGPDFSWCKLPGRCLIPCTQNYEILIFFPP